MIEWNLGCCSLKQWKNILDKPILRENIERANWSLLILKFCSLFHVKNWSPDHEKN